MTSNNTSMTPVVTSPLRAMARQYFVDRIRRGVFSPGKQIPSVRDISRDLGVSTIVTFAAIRELRAERVLEQLANGRHQVGSEAIRLVQGRHIRVGFTSMGIDRIREGIYQSIFNHLVKLAPKRNVEIECLLELHDTWSETDDGHFDVMVVADWKPECVGRLCRGPVIGLDTRGIAVDCVVKTDHFAGGELAGRHLRQQGRRRVVYWDNVKEEGRAFQGLAYRRLGFYKGWVDAGGDIEEIRYVPVLTTDEQDLVPLIQQHRQDADAFFAFWDCGALRLWDAMTKLGIRVPDDIALVGFDGTYEAMTHDPPLTTVRQPCREIAEKVIELLTKGELSRDALMGREFFIPPRFVEGRSS